MRQKTFAENGFERYRKQTRREIFLGEMNEIIPWRELGDVIEPFYPKAEGAGRNDYAASSAASSRPTTLVSGSLS